MKRFFLVSLIILSMVAAVYLAVSPVLKATGQTGRSEQYLNRVKIEIDGENTKNRDLQRNLAKWYNRNLASSEPEPGFETAYREILWYTDGIMGILQLSGQSIPIYHQGKSGAVPGATHLQDSAFPIGGRGNHSVLVLPPEWTQAGLPDNLMVGVYCLGRTMVYQSGSAYNPEKEQLTLIFPDGTGELLLQRTDVVSIQREQGRAGNGAAGKLALTGAVMCCALPLFTAIFLRGMQKLYRTGKNHRKNMEISGC